MTELSLEQLQINGTILKDSALINLITSKVQNLSKPISTSFGPLGLDKMLINSIGDVTLTNDGATIVNNLSVTDPFQKMIVNLANQQDNEVGDGTTTVVLLACELIKVGNELKKNLHSNIIIQGYKLAYRECIKFIKLRQKDYGKLGSKTLVNLVKSSLRSKVVGQELEFFSELVVSAFSKAGQIPVKIYKTQEGSMKDSELFEGYLLNCKPEKYGETDFNGEIKRKGGVKLLCIDFELQKVKLPLNVTINLENVKELENIKSTEENIMKEKINVIKKSGIDVLLTTKGVDDMCLKYLNDIGILVVKRCKKEDVLEICKIYNIDILRTLSDFEGNDAIQENAIGNVEMVKIINFTENKKMILFSSKKSSSIVLKGGNEYLLDEMERSVHDALCVLRRTKESKFVVPSGGSMEIALFLYLQDFLMTISSKENIVIKKYGEALLTLPRLISENAGLDSDRVLAHVLKTQSKLNDAKKLECFDFGIDLSSDDLILNNLEAGVLEPAIVKMKALRAATEAAISVLRIDEMITLNPKPKKERDECH